MALGNTVAVAAAGVGACFVGYCIYFDKKRRSHPDFKKNLILKRKQEREQCARENELEFPNLNDPELVNEFFIKQLQLGETLIGSGRIDEGAKHLAVAVAICGQPSQLLSVLQQSLNPTAFAMLVEALPEVKKVPVILFLLCIGCLASENHFGFLKSDGNIADSHYKEVHRLLIKTLFDSAVKESTFFGNNKLQITLKFSNQNYDLLNDYLANKNSVSPELVNTIVSESIDIENQSLNQNNESFFSFIDFLYDYYVYLVCFFVTLLVVYLLIYKRNVKFYSFSAFLCALVAQKAYKRYMDLKSEKMLHFSKYPDLPSECGSVDQIGYFSYWKYSIKSAITGTDVCKEYFDKLNEHPVLHINMAFILYDVISDIFIYISSLSGECIGRFYSAASKFMNFFYLSIFIFVISVSLSSVAWGLSKFFITKRSGKSRNFRPKKQFKCAEKKTAICD